MSKIQNYLSVAAFAFLGGWARFSLNSQFSQLGTLAGNLLGCFLLAFLTYFLLAFKDFYEWLTVGLGTGFVGAFTTFSTFNLETFKLLQMHLLSWASFYWLSSVIWGIFFSLIGAKIGEFMARKLGEN